VKFCEKCTGPIRPDEEHRSVGKFSTSGSGTTFHYHLACLLKRIRK
jgi:hypothetical protein